ncbi:SIMPL domain-containing protein [Porphyrobacter sp. GA68]|uniref:SIMPL domain-containing protein n=1 Tax=Porphyrobacter sp. GA68 TaxID=2883480 RepID=UPI001D183EE9|nr:SIMPL domain-containing protein [Porphyrobacter sp. GA68]
MLAAALLLTACSDTVYDPRGVEHEETLLSVSAIGEAETRPDQARFQAGVNNWAATARAASDATAADINEIVAALKARGITEQDIQTRAIGVQRIDYGERRGQFQASNVVSVTIRDVNRVGDVVSAVTDAGANIVSGPDFRQSDPEAAANSAYANAYRAARKRAEAYAEAADMQIGRVLTIRDAGGAQGSRYLPGAVSVAPPPVVAPQVQGDVMRPVAEEGGRVLAGQTTSSVAVQVDFALVPR